MAPPPVCMIASTTRVLLAGGRYEPRLTGSLHSHLAGSAHHPGGRLRGLTKIVGAYVGDDDWCSAMVLKAIRRKLKPLDMVEQITDGEHVKNAEQRYLITRAGGSIPLYWLQLMRPAVTEEAAIFAKLRFTQVVERMYNFEESPADHASLARASPPPQSPVLPRPADLRVAWSSPPSPTPDLRATPPPCMLRGAPPIAHVPALSASDLNADPTTLTTMLPTLPTAFASSYRRCISPHPRGGRRCLRLQGQDAPDKGAGRRSSGGGVTDDSGDGADGDDGVQPTSAAPRVAAAAEPHKRRA
eukprot:3253230-Prymnesium_polylepis.1